MVAAEREEGGYAMRVLAISSATVVLLCACAYTGAPESVVRTGAPEPDVPKAAPELAERTPAPQSTVRAAVPESVLRIDNASLASFRASWQQLYRSLSPIERTNLNNAAVLIAFAPYRGVTEVPQSLRNSPIVPEMIRDQIDGMTYPQIIELSNKPAAD
jgi:hypothetical protein